MPNLTIDLAAFIESDNKAAARLSLDLGSAATTDATDYATAAQGSDKRVPKDASVTAVTLDGALTASIDKADSAVQPASLAVQSSGNLDAITDTGYYAPAVSAIGRPEFQSGLLTHVENSGKSFQNFISDTGKKSFARSKSSGVWLPWWSTSEANQSIVAGDNNSIWSLDKVDYSSWSMTDSTFAADGDRALFTPSSPPALGAAVATVALPTSGDFLFRMSVSVGDAAGSGINIGLQNSGQNQVIVSFGYDWSIGGYSAYVANRISMAVWDGAEYIGVQGPTVNSSANPVEVIAQYDSLAGCFNLFVKIAGKWVWYGGVSMTLAYPDSIRISSGGDDLNSLSIKDMSVDRPNYVSIGDSICAGHTKYDPDPSYYAGKDDGENQWQNWCEPSGPENDVVINYGIGGQTSAEIDARVSAMLTATEPVIVFLHASTNDYGGPVPYVTRSANIQSSVDKIVATGAKCVLLNSVSPNSGSGNFPENAAYYREWWEDYADTITGCAGKIDIMRNVSDSDGNADALYFEADGVHPKKAGYQRIGEYITEAISR